VQHAICKQLESIIQEEDEEDRGYITAKDFMNDFATEEFLNKNIRVRPASGITRVDQEETKTNDHHFGGAKGGENTLEEEEKLNKMIKIEMDEQRKNIKIKVRAIRVNPFCREKNSTGRSKLKRRREKRRKTTID
jgi:hypothetical protein